MQALISPDEKVRDIDGNVLGNRVAEVGQSAFPVADPLFWVECADEVVADQFYWVEGEILPVLALLVPEPSEPVPEPSEPVPEPSEPVPAPEPSEPVIESPEASAPLPPAP